MLLEQLYTFYESFDDWSHATLTPGKSMYFFFYIASKDMNQHLAGIDVWRLTDRKRFHTWPVFINHLQFLGIVNSRFFVSNPGEILGNWWKLSFANLNPTQKNAGQRQAPAAKGSWKPQKGRVTVVRCLKALSKTKLYWSLKIGTVVGLSTVEVRWTALRI